ncbi:response regulator [Sphingomonas bacterium]|uniref:response regulator n=1 Tax=Sphingomonas bacterium TaxID=1895847 RepID=UPI00157767BD|nr:response regulator [Sphingomonas bacterium]
MLFARRARKINRILIVEDEPLVAFDNEHLLRDAGYEIVATVDTVAEATAYVGQHPVDLVLADVNLSAGGDGTDVARAAQGMDVPLVFVTGANLDGAAKMAMGVLAKPYNQRDLLATIEAVEAKLAGKTPKRVPKGLTLFD